MPAKNLRTYERTYPWITFRLDLSDPNYKMWLALGDAKSKCQHLALVPLKPSISDEMHRIFLAKGVHATTAIEGNTLSLEEVRRRVDGVRDLPPSKEYLGVEVDNVMTAVNDVANEVLRNPQAPLTFKDICRYNFQILTGLEVEDGVVPGEIRTHEVGVANYSGAPSKDCEYLLSRMCDWLNSDVFVRNDELRIPFGILRAIMAHLYVAWIHPFGDGNGRTARLIEVRILMQAGVPTVAAHLLSNHYNFTRSAYYRQLQRASASNGDVFPFIQYALQGLIDGLVEQLSTVWEQQWMIAFVNHVHEKLAGDGQTEKRQRHLMLALIGMRSPVKLHDLRNLDPKVISDYQAVSGRTLLRDLRKLEEIKMILKTPHGYLANKDYIKGFAPTTC